jgi:hypothetical protein
VRDHVAPGGLAFVSTLSVSDPRHYGRGEPVPGEADSFIEHTYLHLCRRDELSADFSFLEIERLDEIAYHEERPGGPGHDHVSWVLVGRAPAPPPSGHDLVHGAVQAGQVELAGRVLPERGDPGDLL